MFVQERSRPELCARYDFEPVTGLCPVWARPAAMAEPELSVPLLLPMLTLMMPPIILAIMILVVGYSGFVLTRLLISRR